MLLLLSRISREAQKTVFLSTHDLELALQVADEIWLMTRPHTEITEITERGAKLLIGTPHELAQSGALSQFVERGKGIEFNKATLSVRVKKFL
jgi:iron complex transport system ATP-binding protein